MVAIVSKPCEAECSNEITVKKNIKATAAKIKNEVRETILKIGEKIGRLKLPIVHGKYLRKVEKKEKPPVLAERLVKA